MSKLNYEVSPVELADPASLPLFSQPAEERVGRVRSKFSLGDADAVTPEPRPSIGSGTFGALMADSVQRARVRATRVEVDWGLVAALRTAASERLMAALGADTHLDKDAQHALGRRIISELLDDEVADQTRTGRGTIDQTEQASVAQAVFDALFRLGRLQPLVDDDSVENITIMGCDDVWIEHADGRLERGPQVADVARQT